MDDSSEDEQLLDFTVTQFVKRGRQPKQRSVDVVPSDWLSWDKKSNRLKTKFIDDNENDEVRLMLRQLVQTKQDPPESWKEWTVKILGRAATYEEAEKKVKRLEKEENVLTADSEVDVDNRTNLMSESVKRRKLTKSLQDQKNKLQHLNESFEKENVDPSNSPQTSTSDKTMLNKTQDLTTSNNSTESNSNFDIPTSIDSNNQSTSSTILFEGNLPVTSNVFQIVNPANSTTNSPDVLVNSTLNFDFIQCRPGFETAVLQGINRLHQELVTVNKRIDNLTTYMIDKNISDSGDMTPYSFSKKYKINIPIDNNDIFKNFNQLINSNELMKLDFQLLLIKFCDKDFVITKCIVNMLKTIITKNVALKYTSSRLPVGQQKENSVGKEIFKNTIVCRIMFEVIATARKKSRMSTVEKELVQGLTDVLTNVRKWKDGV